MRVVPTCAVLLLIALAGCGAGSPPSTTSGGSSGLTGNWGLIAVSQVNSADYEIGGYIASSSGSITGTVHMVNSLCYTLTQDIPVTGTVSSTGALSLTSSSIGGQILTISGTATSTGLTGASSGILSSGTYSISGGCGNGDHGIVTGSTVGTYTHTYAGNLVSTPSHLTIATSVAATQSGPDADGLYHVSGTATFTNSPCFTSGTISASTIGGNYMSITITTSNGVVTFLGTANTSATTVTGNYQVTGGTCNGDYGAGNLSS